MPKTETAADSLAVGTSGREPPGGQRGYLRIIDGGNHQGDGVVTDWVPAVPPTRKQS
jgi:hypothetical protein